MKTPDEILKGLEQCRFGVPCDSCPYLKKNVLKCQALLMNDAIALIRQLQDENHALRTELKVNRKPIVEGGTAIPPLSPDGPVSEHWGPEVSSDVIMPDQQAKADAGKPRLTLVPPRIIWNIAAVRQYGVEIKYPKTGVDGWRTIGMERIKDAAFRHFMRYLATPHGVDEESGLPHLWHCATNIAFLCELEDSED